MYSPGTSGEQLDNIGRRVSAAFGLPYGGMNRVQNEDVVYYYIGGDKYRVVLDPHEPAMSESLSWQIEQNRYERNKEESS